MSATPGTPLQRIGWEKRLDAIAADCREKGWDSYGADPTTDAALNTALALGRSLDVVPTNDGGIQISMASEALSFEIGPDGEVNNVYADITETTKYVAAMKPEYGDPK